MRGLEVIWKYETDNQNRICAVEVGACSLIIVIVEAMCITELSNWQIFFTKVTPRDILDHLAKYRGGIYRPTFVQLILILHKLWDSDPRMNQFIIKMEEVQQKSVRGKLPISDNMLAAFAT